MAPEKNSFILDITRTCRLSSIKLSKKEIEETIKKILPRLNEKSLDTSIKTALQILEAMRFLEKIFPKDNIDIDNFDDISITAPFRDEILEIAIDELNLERNKKTKKLGKIIPLKKIISKI